MLRQIDKKREREKERERCVLFEFRHFLTLRTRLHFKVSCISLQKILIDEMSLSDCITIINGICADGEQAKAFWFSEG